MIRALLLALVLGACSHADDAVSAAAAAKSAACACKGDPTCVARATDRLAAWHRDYDDVNGTAAQAAKVQADLKAAAACLAPPKKD